MESFKILDESDSIVKYKFLKFRLNTINYVCAHKYVQKLIWNYICTYVCIERNLTKSMLYDISVVCIDEIIVLAYLSIFSYSFKLFIGFFGGGTKQIKKRNNKTLKEKKIFNFSLNFSSTVDIVIDFIKSMKSSWLKIFIFDSLTTLAKWIP